MTPPASEIAGGAALAAATPGSSANATMALLLRIGGLSVVAVALLFIANNYLIFWRGWPGLENLFGHWGWFGLDAPKPALDGAAVTLGWIQIAIYAVPIALITARVLKTPERSLVADAEDLTALSAFIVRAAFWGVLLVGLTDSVISFMRVEGFLQDVVGVQLGKDLGRSNFRGTNVHYPLIGISIIIAIFTRSLSFAWLTLMIVGAEILIVITRFIFSYEQAFMADLVRFWYGALFLFASAHTLVAEGHVRVDILYTGFSERGKAWTNVLGSGLLGIPLCWIILTRGLWGSSNLINGPLINFEVTQQGYGMYVKYFLAAFLLIYAVTMLLQFTSYVLSSAAVLIHERGAHSAPSDHAEI
jgi:TRAP-type mannitol/chloroaromatic compound transport system permease small subunit